jgi:hypothetical protein
MTDIQAPAVVATTPEPVVNSGPTLKSVEAASAFAPAAEPAATEPAKVEQAAADSAAKPDDEAGEEQGEPKPLPKNVQRKIDKLTRQRQEARENVAAKDAETRLLRERLAQYEPQQPAIDPRREPTLADVNYNEDDFKVVWREWNRAVTEADNAVSRRVDTFAKNSPEDWNEAIRAPVEYTPAMLDAIYESDLGPQIGVYLARNLDEADEISGMSPVAAVKAIARIELKLQTKPEPVALQKKVTQTPDPPSLVSGGGAISKSVDDMSTAERIAFWKGGGLKQYQKR